mmetsp:Transcript_16940/g.39116  ORF Transcript_16940/g.39116 Transcript_16940/m.39116 type:complete len:216 (-) Transcript_16940:51-698(-)
MGASDLIFSSRKFLLSLPFVVDRLAFESSFDLLSGSSSYSSDTLVGIDEAILPKGVPSLSPSIQAEKSSTSSSTFNSRFISAVAVVPLLPAESLSSMLLSFWNENMKRDVGEGFRDSDSTDVMDPGRDEEKALAVYISELIRFEILHIHNRVTILAISNRLLLLGAAEDGRSRTTSFSPSYSPILSPEVPKMRRMTLFCLRRSIIFLYLQISKSS